MQFAFTPSKVGTIIDIVKLNPFPIAIVKVRAQKLNSYVI